MIKERKFWTAGEFWHGKFLQVCKDFKSMRDEMESWREASKRSYDLRKDAEKEVRELREEVEGLRDRIWWMSGGF